MRAKEVEYVQLVTTAERCLGTHRAALMASTLAFLDSLLVCSVRPEPCALTTAASPCHVREGIIVKPERDELQSSVLSAHTAIERASRVRATACCAPAECTANGRRWRTRPVIALLDTTAAMEPSRRRAMFLGPVRVAGHALLVTSASSTLRNRRRAVPATTIRMLEARHLLTALRALEDSTAEALGAICRLGTVAVAISVCLLRLQAHRVTIRRATYVQSAATALLDRMRLGRAWPGHTRMPPDSLPASYVPLATTAQPEPARSLSIPALLDTFARTGPRQPKRIHALLALPTT